MTCRFNEQSDNACFRKLQREIEILVHRRTEFIAGRDSQVNSQTLFAVDNSGHAGPGVTDKRNVSRCRMRSAIETAGPDMVAYIVEAHAIRAADEHPCVQDLFLHTLFERWLIIIVNHER